MAPPPRFSSVVSEIIAGRMTSDDIRCFMDEYVAPNAPWLTVNAEIDDSEDFKEVVDELEAEMESGIAAQSQPEWDEWDDSCGTSGDIEMFSLPEPTPHDTKVPPPAPVETWGHLDHSYPRSRGKFCPSEFQKAILDYMQKCRAEICHKFGLVVMATAQGKTILSILDIEREIPSTPNFKFLFLVHTVTIRDGAYAKYKRHFTALGYPSSAFHQVVGGSSRPINGNATFFFCLFQSMNKLPSSLTEKITHVVIDECHHVFASTYSEVHRMLCSSANCIYILGMTATLMHRNDPQGIGLLGMFKDMLYVSLDWAQAKSLGLFPPVEYLEFIPMLQQGHDVPTYDEILKRNERLDTLLRRLAHSVARVGLDAPSPDYIVDILWQYQHHRFTAGLVLRENIIIFCRTTNDADRVAELCNAKSRQANNMLLSPAVSAHYRRHNVHDAIDAFVSGRAKVLSSVLMVNEGFDLPAVDCVVLGRLTESEIVFSQQIGRGLRIDGGKEFTVLDLVLNLRRRWQRLRDESPADEVLKQIRCFWHVDNFVGDFEE